MAISTHAGNTWLNYVLGAGSFTPPTAWYLSFHTADPGLTGASEVNSGTETWYGRQLLAFNAPSARQLTQSNVATYNSKSTGGNITITHVGVWDALTGGNFLHGINITDFVIASGQIAFLNDVEITVVAGGITTTHAHEYLNHIFRNTAMTDAGDVYLALFTASPTDTGSIANEVAASVGYSRQLLTFGSAAAKVASNTALESVTGSGAGMGTITHGAICKAGVRAVADLMIYGTIVPSETVPSGVTLQFPIGDIDIIF